MRRPNSSADQPPVTTEGATTFRVHPRTVRTCGPSAAQRAMPPRLPLKGLPVSNTKVEPAADASPAGADGNDSFRSAQVARRPTRHPNERGRRSQIPPPAPTRQLNVLVRPADERPPPQRSPARCRVTD